MKITIDTKEESKEELKKIINFLQKIIEESNYSTYSSTPTNDSLPSSSPSPQPSQGMFSMFNNEPSTVEPTNMFSDTPSNSNMFSDNQPTPQTIARKEELTDYANNPYRKEEDQPFNVREMLEEY